MTATPAPAKARRAEDPRAEKPVNQMVKVWLFIALVAATALAIWTVVLTTYGAPDSPRHIPWWALTLLVFAGESAVIHLTFRRDAHSFSLSEIVLVISLFLAHPAAILTAQLLGNGASLVIRRQQALVKAVFNVSQMLLTSGLAVLVFRTVLSTAVGFGPAGWVAAVGVSILSIFVAEMAIDTVIRLTGGKLTLREMGEAMTLGSIGATVNATLGLLATFVIWYDIRAWWLAVIPPSVMYAAYWTHAAQRNQHQRLESMHAVTEAIHTAPDMNTALIDAAASARQLVNATWLEITVFPDDLAGPHQTVADLEGRQEVMVPRRLQPELPAWWQAVVGDAQSVMLESASSSAVAASPAIKKDAIVAPIVGAERLYGYVLAADRLGDVSTFSIADTHLLETVGKQVSVSLDNGRLETSLASVTALKEQLEDVIKSKDQFVASISHELRTPLTAVVGLAEEVDLSLSTIHPTELKEFVSLIAEQSNELAYIIDDLLVAARADIGTLAVHRERVNVMETVSRMAQETPTQTAVEVRGDCGSAWADPMRLRQVVRNLLSNARRYGGETISIEVKQHARCIEIAVIDDGQGVPSGREAAIFEAYERGHQQATLPGSVGLGLAVARQLARMMDGDIEYERADDETRFVFTVPAADTPESALLA